MSRTSNKPIDVFKYVNMLTGPEWTDPETGEVSRCWPFTGALNAGGRPYISIEGKKELAYHVVFKLVKGYSFTNIHRHKCDNEICCNPDHAIEGTHQENMNDMKERERHGLPHHTVRLIKKNIKNGFSDEAIGVVTGVDRKVINNIRNETSYAHVKENE